MRTIMGFAIAVILVAVASADEKVDKIEKIDAQMLIGKWKGVNQDQGSMEFTKDGKFKMTNVKGEVIEEGTYKVDGNKVTAGGDVTTIGHRFEHNFTVLKLTETDLVVTNIVDGPKKPQSFIREVEKIDPKILIGKWKGVNQDHGSMEFTKDGKYKMTNAKGEMTNEGTYKVEGMGVNLVSATGTGFIDNALIDNTIGVLKLTEAELVIEDIHRGARRPHTFNRDK